MINETVNNKKTSNERLKKIFSAFNSSLQGLFGIFILFLIWYLACKLTSVGELLADPITVLKLLGSWFLEPIGRMTLPGHILISMRRVFTAYIILSVVGIFIGIIIGYSKLGRALLNPLYEMVRPVPGVAWIPVTIMLFGIGEDAKVFLIILGCISGVILQASRGVGLVDRQLVGAARVLGASEGQVFWKVILPSCVPSIFVGLNGALASSWSCVLAAEMISAFEGVGWIITAGASRGNTAQILAGMIPIGVMGVILTSLITWAEKKLCRWTERSE